MQNVLTSLVAVATIIGGLAALGGWLHVLTADARLRRQEELWRQIAGDPDDGNSDPVETVVRDLHRHAVAQLVARELTRDRTVRKWLWAVMGLTVLAGLLGWSAAEHGTEAMAGERALGEWHGSLRYSGSLTVVTGVFTGLGLAVIAGQQWARHRISTDILARRPLRTHTTAHEIDYMRQQLTEGRLSGAPLLLLGVMSLMGVSLTVLSACTIFITRLFVWGWGRSTAGLSSMAQTWYAQSILTAAVIVLVALLSALWLWWRVARPPTLALQSTAIERISTEPLKLPYLPWSGRLRRISLTRPKPGTPSKQQEVDVADHELDTS